MLGYDVFVYEAPAPSPGDNSPPLLQWRTGSQGLRWLDRLVAGGRAAYTNGGGYPERYALSLGELLAALEHGLPKHGSPLVVGDDYVLPPGYNGPLEIDRNALASLDPSARLVVEAWDMS